MTSRNLKLLRLFILVSLGIGCIAPQQGHAVDSPYFVLDLDSALDSQLKHFLTIGLLGEGESECMDVVPPPEPCGFDFYIASGLAWPWDRLWLHLVPKAPEQSLYSWRVLVVAPAGQQVTVSWDASSAPPDVSLYFTEVHAETGEPVGDTQDMKTTTSLIVEGGPLAPLTKVFEFQMRLSLPLPYDYATGDHATESGAITAGSYLDTQEQDNLAEALVEAVMEKGKPSKRHDELSHVWTFEVTGGNWVVFCVDACKTPSPDGDDFLFSYSTDGVSYMEMLTVRKTIDDDSYQCCPLPNTVTGTVYVKVRDTDRCLGNQNLDTLCVDHMFILCSDRLPDLPPEAPENLTAIGGDGEVVLDWEDNSELDLDHYCVYRSFCPDRACVWLANTSGSTYVDSDVDNGTRCYYVVTAVDMAAQESGFGNIASATAGASPVIRVANIEMSRIATGRKWSAVANVTVLCQNGYPVEGAKVSYTWSGVHKGVGDVLTSSDGVVTVVSGSTPKAGTTVFTVRNVSRADRVFDEAASVKWGSMTGP